LQNILEKEQNRLYLYNMLNVLLKLGNKEKLETYLNKLKDYNANFKYEKSEFEYFTLLNVYMFLDKKEKFEKLWQKIPLYIRRRKEFKNIIENYENETISYVISLTQYIKNYENKRFDFAFSFAGSEDVRRKIKKIKDELQEKGYQVFYDEEFTSEMQKVIHPKNFLEWIFKTSKYVIMIVDKNYIDKINLDCDFENFKQECYVKFEFETIKQRANNFGREFLIMFKVDDISLNEYGLNSDVYFNIEELNTETILKYFKEE